MELNKVLQQSVKQQHATLARRCFRVTTILAASLLAHTIHAQTIPVIPCTPAGIGAVSLVGDGAPVTILSAEPMTTAAPASVPYCLVKVLIPRAINIWVGLPDRWNGRWQSLGGGGYAGAVSAPTSAINEGYAGANRYGAFRRLGHFGMTTTAPLAPTPICRSTSPIVLEHLMAVIGKELVRILREEARVLVLEWLLHRRPPGSHDGAALPDDYDGILAGAPAIHWTASRHSRSGRRWRCSSTTVDLSAAGLTQH
jgi:hypothetical protein